MANIDSPIFDYLRDVPEGATKVAIEHLYELLRQTRDRTGGDTDLVSQTASASSTNFYAGGFYEEQKDCGLFPIPENEEHHEFNERYALLLS